ncbi:IS1634 family transposase [Elusimicrobiota bacterium]
MFVRKKRNKSGSVSIQIIDKENGYRVAQTVGSSSDKDEIERLFLQGQRIVHADPPGQQWLFPFKSKEDLAVENCFADLTNAQVRTIGPELIFGSLFDRIGFNDIKDDLFRHLVIARLVYPTSKLKTIDYLERYQGLKMPVSTIYRFLDRLESRYKDQAAAIAYNHTKKCLKTISVVFYDMTTLYFEAGDEDDLRKTGFSKDGKFQKPQILLGLLVGEQGLPISYDIFEGNTFEGHTLLPALKKIQEKYALKQPIVVADAALLSKDNINNLAEQQYRFIIGGRIKNESEGIKEIILKNAQGASDGKGFIIKKPDGTRLIVTYSAKRAKKDEANRRRGLAKLRQRVKSGLLTKQSIHNRGYNRFLAIHGKATITIDEEKVRHDELWDGLKGYITNTRLPLQEVVDNYVHLWQIERAFRISKTDLKVRPVYHYQRRRIEAHICIAFVAYSIYKELELLLKKHAISMSPKRAAELTQNMYQLHYSLPSSGEQKRQLLKMDAQQQLLYDTVCR